MTWHFQRITFGFARVGRRIPWPCLRIHGNLIRVLCILTLARLVTFELSLSLVSVFLRLTCNAKEVHWMRIVGLTFAIALAKVGLS